MDGIREIVEKAGYELALLEKYESQTDFVSAVMGVDVLIMRSDKVTAEIIEAAPKLKMWSVTGPASTI